MPYELRLGVSGWRGISASRHPLSRLCDSFEAVEIKQTFDQIVRPEVARLWVRQVESNPRFRFSCKLHRDFTHERVFEHAADWSTGILPLHQAGRLDAVLMQFPWSFKFTRENRDHVIRLRRTFHAFPLAAEFRHESWMLDEALGTLIDYKIGFCNIDQPEFVRAMPPTRLVTAAVAYVRLHGRNSFGFYQNSGPGAVRYDYEYSSAELQTWAERIEHLRSHAARTVVIANNDAGPKAWRAAAELQSILGAGPQRPSLFRVPARGPVQTPMFGQWQRVA
jgi:uncharacterized protein YecE (DUF72 family)